VQTGSLQTESYISSLSWNLEGTRLLTGGEILQLWHQHVALVEEDSETGSAFINLTDLGSWGSSVSIVSDYGLDSRGSIPDRGRGFFL
jgi:hypothetical protein